LTPVSRREDKSTVELENSLRQVDRGIELIEMYLEPDRPFSLRPHHILDLHHVAMDRVMPDAGRFRTYPATIGQSKHVPPHESAVPMLVTEMCEYVNDNWHEKTAFHLSAYVMWRLNWIHPFGDGNGRTSRITAYAVLSAKLGYLLPGSPTIFEQIESNGDRYIGALEAADNSISDCDVPDFSSMEEMLRDMLAKQLLSVIETASGETLT